MCFFVVLFTSERKLRRRANSARYPWAESDFVYSISEEEKSDILDRISNEVRKAVAQAAEDTKIQLQNKAVLAKNAMFGGRNLMYEQYDPDNETTQQQKPTQTDKHHYSIVQKSRQIEMASSCKDSNSTWDSLTDEQRKSLAQRIVVNDQHQMLYCTVPLIATSSWMKVMYFLGEYNDADSISKVSASIAQQKTNHVWLSSLSEQEQKKRIDTYLKFIVARHPFLRIIAVYKTKFDMKNEVFQRGYGRNIVKKYRHNPPPNPVGDDVKFSEFVHFLVDDADVEKMNEHWQPLYTLCRPCELQYDYILHHETVKEDAMELLNETSLDTVIPDFPVDNWDQVKAEYVRATMDQLNPALIGKLVQKYDKDLAIFSYSTLY